MRDRLHELRRDGFTVLPGFLDPVRRQRLLEIADGLHATGMRRHPVTGRRELLMTAWHIPRIDQPHLYDAAPDWWLPEVLELVGQPEILDTWQSLTGALPVFARASLLVDPPLPYALDGVMQAVAAADGAGMWHRNLSDPSNGEAERAGLLRGMWKPDGCYVLEVALLPSDAFEYVPGSHARWDTPQELVARRDGRTLAERTQPLPGGRRLPLQPGDALLADGSGIHRGWYPHGVRRRTVLLSYMSERYLEQRSHRHRNPPLPCALEDAHLARLGPESRAFFERWLDLTRRAAARPTGQRRSG